MMINSFSVSDYEYMALAIRLAEKGRYTTAPNPNVGCVMVKNNQIVGQGYHHKAGQLHAERNAIADAADAAKGSTAYVTLEPCCHHGKTPPCTDGLIDASVNRVVIAMKDPNPLVSGKGIALLEQAGIDVSAGLMAEESKQLNLGFISRMKNKKPYVRCKLGMSLDGRTAMKNGESQWITGSEAREDVQRLRALSSAVVTGIGTILADDPSLNVRLGGNDILQPLRVVLDSKLQFPLNSKMIGLEGDTLIVCSDDVDESKVKALISLGVDVERCPSKNGSLELSRVMTLLSEKNINEVLIEAGATLAGASLQAGIVDELIVYMAPTLLGNDARALVNLPGLDNLRDKINLNLSDVRCLGDDLKLVYTF